MKKVITIISAIAVAVTTSTLANFKEKEISPDKLPAAVKEAVQKLMPNAEIEEAEEIKTKAGMLYEVEIEMEKDGKEIEISFLLDAQGKLIKKEVEEEDEDEDCDDDEHEDDEEEGKEKKKNKKGL